MSTLKSLQKHLKLWSIAKLDQVTKYPDFLQNESPSFESCIQRDLLSAVGDLLTFSPIILLNCFKFKTMSSIPTILVTRYCQDMQFASIRQSEEKLFEIRLKEGKLHFQLRSATFHSFSPLCLCDAVKHIWSSVT